MANDQASTSSAVDTGLCADAERSFFDNVPDFVTPLPPLDAPDDFVDLSHHLLSPLLVENDWESVEQRLQSAYWMEPIDDLVDIDIGEAVRTVDAKALVDDDAAIDRLCAAVRRHLAARAQQRIDEAAEREAARAQAVVRQPPSPVASSSGVEADAHARRLMEKALDVQLQLSESQLLIDHLRSAGEAFIDAVDLSAEKLPRLVECNPMIAVEVFLLKIHSAQITDYFSVLLRMDLSVHSMEVVNRLTILVDVSETFLRLYVERCIHACQQMPSGPPNGTVFAHSRLVRMVCVFLSSLIRNKFIDQLGLDNLYVDMRQFCVANSNVKEAAALYQTITLMNTQRMQHQQKTS